MSFDNIYTQLCGIVIVTLIIIMFLLQRKLSVRNELYFLRCLIMNSILLVVDIAATMLKMWDPNALVTNIFAKVWCIVMLVDLISIVLYVAGSVFSKRGYRKLFIITIIAGIICGILMMLAPIYITYENGNIDTTGSCIWFSYFCGAITIAYIIYVSIRYKNRMSSDKPHIIRIWMGMWVFMTFLQFILPHFLIASFTISLGLLVIFIKLETMDTYIDNKTGLFNNEALLKCLDDYKRNGIIAKAIYLKPSEYQLNMTAQTYFIDPLSKMNDELRKRRSIITIGNKKEYILVLHKSNKDYAIALINNYEAKGYLLPGYRAYYFDNANRINSFLDYENIINTIDSNDVLVDVDNKIVDSYYKYQEAEEIIRSAMDEDRVVVYYQPIYSINSNRFTSAEALVRIKGRDGKLIPPNEFIPVAERTGLIHRLDEIVFNKVCQFISNNNMYELKLDYIEVNLSAVQLSDENLAKKYITILNNNNTDPTYINLEITESASLEKSKILDMNMNKLIDYNVSFSLDDYGTGYSNLNHIIKLPVSIIKFDKQMTDSYFNDVTARYMMTYSIQMFHSMNLHVVIEGVETKEQMQQLKELGVDYIQGYVFSRPIPEDELIEFVKKNNV